MKIASSTLWVEYFDEIVLSCTVKEMKPICGVFFAFFGKNLKIQNGRHFWGEEIFLKIAKSTLLRHPTSRKFQQNRSISQGLGDRSKFVFCIFGKNSKWSSFLGIGISQIARR